MKHAAKQKVYKMKKRGGSLNSFDFDKSFSIENDKKFKIEELEHRVVIKELNNKVLEDETKKVKGKLLSLSEEAEANEFLISKTNIEMINNFNTQKKLKENLKNVTEQRIQAEHQLNKLQNDVERIEIEYQTLVAKKRSILIEEAKLLDLQKKIEIKLFYNEEFKEDIENENKRIAEHLNIFKTLKEKHDETVKKIQERILSVEELAKKVEAQTHLIEISKNQLKNDSSYIFNRSKELLNLLKTVTEKIGDIDEETEKAFQRQKEIENKIIEYKAKKEKEERLNYFRSKFS